MRTQLWQTMPAGLRQDSIPIRSKAPKPDAINCAINPPLQSWFQSTGGQMFEKNLLQAKRILITGGGTGLGKAAALRFLELGAEVYICGRRQEVLAAAEQELRQSTGGHVMRRVRLQLFHLMA